jgi:hypothetical protein
VNVGATNTMTLPTSGNSYLVGEVIPYGGPATNAYVNLNGFADFTQVLVWDPVAGNYTTFQTDHTSPTLWDDGGFNPTTPPVIGVGQGFFLIPSANNTMWSQNL